MGNTASITVLRDGAQSEIPSPTQAAADEWQKRHGTRATLASPKRSKSAEASRLGAQDLDQIYRFVRHMKQTKVGEELLDNFVVHQAEHTELQDTANRHKSQKPPPPTTTVPAVLIMVQEQEIEDESAHVFKHDNLTEGLTRAISV
jgi:hypothetical protein